MAGNYPDMSPSQRRRAPWNEPEPEETEPVCQQCEQISGLRNVERALVYWDGDQESEGAYCDRHGKLSPDEYTTITV